MNNIFKATIFICFLLLLSCSSDYLRGYVEPSKDGKTYLVVADNNGGYCGPLKVDGKKWIYKINQAGEISPGVHTIECGGKIEFEIPEKVTFYFNYWGP